MPRGTTPKIVWNGNTLTFAYAMDNARAWSEPSPSSRVVRIENGVTDGWHFGDDYFLAGDVRWIPTTDSGGATGWDGATGWGAFIRWASRGNSFDFHPDKDSATHVESYLEEPRRGDPSLEDGGTRRLTIKLRSADGSAYDGY